MLTHEDAVAREVAAALGERCEVCWPADLPPREVALGNGRVRLRVPRHPGILVVVGKRREAVVECCWMCLLYRTNEAAWEAFQALEPEVATRCRVSTRAINDTEGTDEP